MTTPPPPGNPFAAQASWRPPYGQPGSYATGCRFCAGLPTAKVTFRGHQGMVLRTRSQQVAGEMCAVCGTAVFREMTTRTLWQGWWSPFSLFLLAPFALVRNLVARRRITALQPPVAGRHGPQVPIASPVHRRPLAYVALLPALWVGYLLLVAAGLRPDF
ncbi:hypothetical protein [Streptomyces triticagri]|uniref:hypothetical protein n=1 Tax=Streptomyces triticagri TaxID=2293568 RepID=UPI000FFC3C8A|nr:hypothetical protein [Streptomyces triticagri]